MRRVCPLLCTCVLPSLPLHAEPLLLAAEQRVPSPQTVELAFQLPQVPAGQQVRLSLDARVDWPGFDGSNPWLSVAVNGQNVLRPDLLNKPFEFTMRCGMDTTWAYGSLWRIVYAPDFTETLRTVPMPLGIADVDPYRFVWDITAKVHPGTNKASFHHPQLLPQGTTLVLRNVTVEVGDPLPHPEGAKVKPPPTGPLPTYMPHGAQQVKMRVEVGERGGLCVTAGGRTCEITTRTSEPEGRWRDTDAPTAARDEPAPHNAADATRRVAAGARLAEPGSPVRVAWLGTGYRVARLVEVRSDHIHVTDTLSNTTDADLGVIYENRLRLADTPRDMLIGGRPVFGENQEAWVSCHPTALAMWDDLALGIVAEDDIYRVHSLGFRRGEYIGVSDPQLCLPAGKSHTLEWSIYPVPDGDYWDFVNAIRRNWGCNITLPGPATFEHAPKGDKPMEFYRNWARVRGLTLAFSGQTAWPDGRVAEGTAIPLAKEWCDGAREWIGKLHEGAPETKVLIYLHAQICTEPEAQTLYADSRLLWDDGKQLTSPYHYPVYLYLVTLENSYGKALMRTAKQILEDLGADGFYHDEFEFASTPHAYSTAWDGCTGIIDPQTHALVGKRSSVTLLQQPWKQELVDSLRASGKFIYGNGQPTTRTMLNLQVPRFVESPSYSFLIEAHLGTPMGLGNHENVGGDPGRAEMARRMLDYGGLLVIYDWPDTPQGLHFMRLMYPTTPLELRAGMVLGKERIVTNRSGKYGWPDGSAAEAYVFDAEGKQVPDAPVREVQEGGRRLTEVRMRSDCFAILVRKAA